MAESLQHKLDRVRRPRVQITYDVETNGALQKTELPFVVGVLADLSGAPKDPLRPIKDRKMVQIDRDNFNGVLATSAPRPAMRGNNESDGRESPCPPLNKVKRPPARPTPSRRRRVCSTR